MMLEVLKPFLYKDRLYRAGDVLAIGPGNEEMRRAVTAARSGYLVRMTIQEVYTRITQYCREVGARSTGEVLEVIRVMFGLGEGGINPPAQIKGKGTKRGRRGKKIVCRQGV
jgi:hypothetical protein